MIGGIRHPSAYICARLTVHAVTHDVPPEDWGPNMQSIIGS
jgi:hypothetical protein